ncbi:MAG TPA: cellulase family glycosylhydrolase, partial [Rubrivivax sp.]|nr:cellulase family glycosylhydrolase [Rubrivivax sp.]
MSRTELPPLDLQGGCFVDAHGRQVILRGVNLGGDSKVPYPDGGTHHPSGFADHRSVSFVGRPFPLDEADEHFARIAHWGFNCLRMLTTWEAVEHAGPGQYDSAYLDYFQEICRRAGEHGLYVIVDFHQDVWSRMTGGDGAPGWVFDALGLDFTRFHAAGAAHVMQRAYRYDDPTPHQDGYPPMSWASNYRRPANGILWTLFWAGRTLTPAFRVDDRNVQDFLQTHLLGAMDQVAQRLKHLTNVIGFDTLNEPGTGWLGQALTPAPMELGQAVPVPALPGLVWSPLQALGVARGLPTQLPVVGHDDDGVMRVQSWQVVNPDGVSIWRQSGGCPFEQAGIYTVHNGQAVPLRSDAFQRCEGREFSLANDAYGPYFHVVADTIRRHNPQWLVFAEIDPFGSLAGRPFPREMPARSVNASHWYDVTLLLGKQFDSAASVDVFTGQVARGSDELRDRHVRQLTRAMQPAQHFAGGAPTLIGEFGIPYDLNSGSAYSAWAEGRRDDAVWRDHIDALSLMYDAMDRLLLSSTQWNY